MRVLILDILNDHGAADVLGASDGIAQGLVRALDEIFAGAGIVVEIVVGPTGVGAVDDHLRRADGGADIEALQQAPGDDGADIGIFRGDGEAPERAVNTEAAGMTVKKAFGPIGKRRPVAIQNLGVDEALQFEIAGLFEKPVAVKLEIIERHGGADDGKRRHGCAP